MKDAGQPADSLQVRAPRAVRALLPLLTAVGLVAGLAPAPSMAAAVPAAAPAPVAATAPVRQPVADYQPAFPVKAAFYYAWYPSASTARSRYRPDFGAYDASDVDVVRRQIDSMQYAGQQAGIYSWWGRGSFEDRKFGTALRAADDTSFRWALYYEPEGPKGTKNPYGPNPSAAHIRADLDSIHTRFARDRSYLRVGGKPVLFVWADPTDSCAMASRWAVANRDRRFHVVLKHVNGYTGCAQPASWHQYAPASRAIAVGKQSYAVSPGFFGVNEGRARLGRSPAQFRAAAARMKASGARWQLTTTWNEWAEGTAVESAAQWRSASRHGAYADALHAVYGSAAGQPSTPAGLRQVATPGSAAVRLAWAPAARAQGYGVYRNGCLVATTGATTWLDRPAAGRSWTYAVSAINFRSSSRKGGVLMARAGVPARAPLPTAPGEGLVTLPARRILASDTGGGVGCAGRLRGAVTLTLPATVPATARAVVLGVTAVGNSGTGTVRVSPAGLGLPPVAQLHYGTDRAAATSSTVVPVGTGRQVVVHTTGAPAHVRVDLLGYTAPAVGGGLTMAGRNYKNLFANTRNGTGLAAGPKVGTVTAALPDTVPADATAVQLNMQVVRPAGAGTVTAFPAGSPAPGTTSLSHPAAHTVNGSVLVPVDRTRRIGFRLTSRSDLMVEVVGWVTRSSAARLTTQTPLRLHAATVPAGHVVVALPATAPVGSTALVNLGVTRAAGFGTASVAPGSEGPILGQLAYSPQQGSATLALVKVPASRRVTVKVSTRATVYLDLLGTA